MEIKKMLDAIINKFLELIGQVDAATVKEGLGKAADAAEKAAQAVGGSGTLESIWSQYSTIIIGVVAVVVLYHFISLPFKFLVNGLIGCVMLMAVNWVGGIFNMAPVPINIITALVAGIAGIPGVVAVVAYYLFIH